MSKTVHWSDGTDWTVDDETYRRALECLEAVQEPVWGLEPILSRWASQPGSARVEVDVFAPSEDDRAIVTAGLERAVEHAKRSGCEGLGMNDPREFGAFVEALSRLHELFVTDVTHKLSR
ncbi:MAG: hypothetical protein WCJ30_22105 [Deltaproteobacteria bacterium]